MIAPSHIDSYLAINGVTVTALCDLRPDRMTAIRNRYPQCDFLCYTDFSQMLTDADVDAISICTDHASHELLLAPAVAADKHVLCEKPLTTSTASLERMLQCAANSQLVLAGVFQHRFDGIYDVVKDLLAEGALGGLLTASAWHQCFRPDDYYRSDAWRGTWAHEGGSLLINQSIHFLDILQWVTGGVSAVSAFITNSAHADVIETEDTAAISLKFRNGALGTFVATSGSNSDWRYGMHLVGTCGEIELRDGKLFVCRHKDPELRARIEQRLAQVEVAVGVDSAKQYYGNGHPAQIHDFINAIRTGRAPKVSLQEAAHAVRIVLATYDSARTGTQISLSE